MTAEGQPKRFNAERTADNSVFFTPEMEKQSCRSHSPQSSPQSDQNQQNITKI